MTIEVKDNSITQLVSVEVQGVCNHYDSDEIEVNAVAFDFNHGDPDVVDLPTEWVEVCNTCGAEYNKFYNVWEYR